MMTGAEYASALQGWIDSLIEVVAEVDDGTGKPLGDRVVFDPMAPAAATAPAVIIGSPSWDYASFCADGPTNVRLDAYVLADPGEPNWTQRLWAITLDVAAALEAGAELSVTGAQTGAWMQGGTPRPAYVVRCEGSITAV
jgi:hypothetical protein